MAKQPTPSGRAFKSSGFAKSARKADIEDEELCTAITKGGRYWVYVYLFAKKDRENIEDDELREFRVLAKGYENLADKQLARLLKDKDLTEICYGDQA